MKGEVAFCIVGSIAVSLAAVGAGLWVFFAGSLLSGFWGLLISLKMVREPTTQFGMLRLLASSILLGNSFGAVVSVLVAEFGDVGGFDVILLYYSLTVQHLAFAQLIINGFSLALIMVSSLPLFNSYESGINNQLMNLAQSSLGEKLFKQILLILSLLELSAMATGMVGYRAYAVSEEIDPATLLLVTSAPTAVFALGALIGYMQSRKRGWLDWGLLGFGVLINYVWFLAAGRSQVLASAALGVIGYSWVQRFSLRRLIFSSLLVVLPLMLVAFYVTQANRYFQAVDEFEKVRIDRALMLLATDTARSSNFERSDLAANNAFNYAQRPLVTNYIAQLVERRMQGESTWVGFEDLFNNLLNAVPRKFYPAKGTLLIAEPLYAERLGLPASDNADSLPFSAYACFDVFGLVIYPLLGWVYIGVLLWLLLLFKSDRVLLVGMGCMMWMFLSGWEMAVTNVFVMPRNLFLLAFVIKGFELFLGGQQVTIIAPRVLTGNRSQFARAGQGGQIPRP